MSPFEFNTGQTPSLEHLKVWFCKCYVSVPRNRLRANYSERSWAGFFLHYEDDGYAVLCPDRAIRTILSTNVTFDEMIPGRIHQYWNRLSTFLYSVKKSDMSQNLRDYFYLKKTRHVDDEDGLMYEVTRVVIERGIICAYRALILADDSLAKENTTPIHIYDIVQMTSKFNTSMLTQLNKCLGGVPKRPDDVIVLHSSSEETEEGAESVSSSDSYAPYSYSSTPPYVARHSQDPFYLQKQRVAVLSRLMVSGERTVGADLERRHPLCEPADERVVPEFPMNIETLEYSDEESPAQVEVATSSGAHLEHTAIRAAAQIVLDPKSLAPGSRKRSRRTRSEAAPLSAGNTPGSQEDRERGSPPSSVLLLDGRDYSFWAPVSLDEVVVVQPTEEALSLLSLSDRAQLCALISPVSNAELHDYSDYEKVLLLDEPVPPDPASRREAMASAHRAAWLAAEERELNSLKAFGVLLPPVKTPPGFKPFRVHYVYKVKRLQNAIENWLAKSRLTVDGSRQKQGTDFWESFSPTGKNTTFRMLMALATLHGWTVHHMDVVTAFLNAALDEKVYIQSIPGQPPLPAGFSYPLGKSLYGLRQAPRNWYHLLTDFIKGTLGFAPTAWDHCLFTKQFESAIVLIFVYVDDLLILSSSDELITDIKRQLSERFNMKDLGALMTFLGMSVVFSERKCKITQTQYALQVLERFYEQWNPIFPNGQTMPLPAEAMGFLEHMSYGPETLCDQKFALWFSEFPYRSVVGALLYLAMNRIWHFPSDSLLDMATISHGMLVCVLLGYSHTCLPLRILVSSTKPTTRQTCICFVTLIGLLIR
jgi:hypothetical protein